LSKIRLPAPSRYRRFALLALLCLPVSAGVQNRAVASFDSGWRFSKGDPTHAESPDFDDAYWHVVNLPHDWNSPEATGGVGWYRKHFVLPGPYEGQRLLIEFDGVLSNSDVWINGVHLGSNSSGFVGFRYELTAALHKGMSEMNVLAVRVDSTGGAADASYRGAGINRHVRLFILNPVHLGWNTVVTTPRIASGEAIVHVALRVENQSDAVRNVSVQMRIAGPDGKPLRTLETAVQSIAAGGSSDFERDLRVAAPELWEAGNPALYRAIMRVRQDAATVDEETTAFGIRSFLFEENTGFWMNGRNFKFKGVALHEDGGAFGAAIPLGVWERRLGSLKEVGVNAIRVVDHPVAPEFLDLCDRLGFLVMEEMAGTAENKAEPVRRDRNHPSLILYSTKNGMEIIAPPSGEPLRIPINVAASQFQWTGFDYLGADGNTGLFDRTGRPRPPAFKRKSWWSDEPVVYIVRRTSESQVLPDWTPAGAAAHVERVEVYSNCETVELLLNGKSLGSKPRPADDSPRLWNVPFASGTLQALGTNKGQQVARHELRTAAKATRIVLVADRPRLGSGWDDVVYLRATVVDDQGTPVPGSKDVITFQGNGPALFSAFDNGAAGWHDAFRGPDCKASDGQCVAILKAKAQEGAVTVSASAPGLTTSGLVTLRISARELAK
jgi:hypothetical protein